MATRNTLPVRKRIQTQGLGEYARRGFTLEYLDDVVFELLHDGEQIGIFSAAGSSDRWLQEECARHLVFKHGWDGCLWEGGQHEAT